VEPISALVAIIAEAKLPDPGQASIVPTAGVVGSVLGGAYGFLVGGSAEEAERLAFAFGLLAAGAALLTYLTLLIGGVP
jgi:hypothetical protein